MAVKSKKKSKKESAAQRKKKAQAAAKRRTQKNKAKTPAAAAAKKPAVAVNGAPAAGQPMIIDGTGKPVHPDQWKADQARLMAAQEDNEAMAAIEGEEATANLDEQAEGVEAASLRDKRIAAAKRSRAEFAEVKPVQQAKLNSSLAYRGMGRGSASKRKTLALAAEQGKMDTEINNEQSGAVTDYTSAVGSAAQRRKARIAALAPRKQLLAQRGARSGVYTK